jgi:DNA-binding GntR family transcriptional regulator
MNAGRVYNALRDRIVRGRLAPGSRLIELELADRLGVSRTPLRAALQRLQTEGYVLSGAGMRQSRLTVAPLTANDAQQLFLVIGALEGVAAHMTASLPTGARRSVASALREINDALQRAAAAQRPDHDRLLKLDEQFHQCYVDAGAGDRLKVLYAAVKPQAERYERLYVSLLTREIATSVREHQRIVVAIRDGLAQAAVDAVQANWRNAAHRLSAVIANVGELGEW